MSGGEKINFDRGVSTGVIVVALVVIAAIAGMVGYYAAGGGGEEGGEGPSEETIKVGAPFTTPIEEPWDGVIHNALLKAENELNIEYEWTDDVGYADIPRVLREWAPDYDIVFGDVFGAEAEARDSASDFPSTQFAFGSGLGPSSPNVSVFDDWIHEPAFLCGMIAGKITETDSIGAVGGIPVPEVNRLLNAYIEGAKWVNPDVEVKISFVGDWFDPTEARELASAQIEAGADVLYAERYGVHNAALDALDEGNVVAIFGNMLDQYELAEELVITGPVWNMYPTVEYLVEEYRESGEPMSIDLAEWSMMKKGGAYLAPWHDWQNRLNSDIVSRMQEEDVVNLVESMRENILAGTFEVPVDESKP